MGKILAQSTVASDQLVSEAENLKSQVNVEPKHLSTPVNSPTHSKVHIANGSNSHFTSSPLANTQSAPTKTTIMEEIPSPVIIFETNLVSMDNSLVPPHSHAHDSPPTNQIAHITQITVGPKPTTTNDHNTIITWSVSIISRPPPPYQPAAAGFLLSHRTLKIPNSDSSRSHFLRFNV
ncbi:hypothetical protein YC2023_007721 [Brassica napus]